MEHPFGIDISKYQNPDLIDYNKIADQVDFVIMRIGFGWLKDIHFERHYLEFTQRGKRIGGYHFPLDTRLQEQANMVKQALDGKRIEVGLWVDVEATYQSRSEINAYIPLLESTLDTEAGVYTSYSKWLEVMQNETRWASRRLWVANYGVFVPKLPSPWKKWCVWQYSSTGRLNGYSGNLDLDWANAECLDAIPAIGEETPPEPPVEKLFDAKVTTDKGIRLKTRYTPAGKERPDTDWLASGAIVPVYETHSTGWWRVAPEAWSSTLWMKRVGNEPPPITEKYYGALYWQRDPRWKDKPLGTSGTIGSYGCVMTAETNVLNQLGIVTNPVVNNAWRTANGGYHNGNLIVWEKVSEQHPDIIWEGKTWNPTDAQIKQKIAAGCPLVMLVDHNEGTPALDEHWVNSIPSPADDDAIWIHDPWDNLTIRLRDRYKKPIQQFSSYRRNA